MNNRLDAFISKLKNYLPAELVMTDPEICKKYGADTSRNFQLPQVVTLPNNTQQIQKIVLLCNEYKIPLTTRGAGTGTTGAAVPLQGGMVLSCENMQRVIKVDPANRIMVVEPGVLNQTVQDIAAQHGFFWAPDPGSAATCTVGGNLACNAAGPRAIKYGSCRENTLALTAVTGNGEIICTGARTTKSAVGYDLTRLLIGSEGTLAIITEATLKLIPLPQLKKTIRILYQDIHTATQAITHIMSQPVIPCALEFIDKSAIHLIRAQGIDLPASAEAMLLIVIEGDVETIKIEQQKLIAAAKNNGVLEIIYGSDIVDDQKLWAARKALSLGLKTLAPIKINEDIVVPVAQLPDLISELEKLAAKYYINIVNFGHGGNGNLHVNLMVNPEQLVSAKACLSDIFDLVLKLNGCLSGEHGIGIEKMNFIAREINPATLHIMRQIKKVFDPNAILNPQKLFPDA